MLALSDYALIGVTLVVALAAVTILSLLRGRSLSAKVGSVQFTLDAIAPAIHSIDRAVNHRDEADTSISDDVKYMRAEVDRLRAAMGTLHGENVDKIAALIAEMEALTKTVHTDRHAIRNDFSRLLVAVGDQIRAEFERQPIVGPAIKLPPPEKGTT